MTAKASANETYGADAASVDPTASGEAASAAAVTKVPAAVGRAGAPSADAELVESRAVTAALCAVVTAIAHTSTADAAAHVGLQAVREAFGWSYGSFWRRDRDTDLLVFATESGSVSPEFRDVTVSASFAEGVGLSGRTWAARDVVFVPDLAEVTDCVRAPAARAAGVRSGVCLPVLVDGEVVATMDFFATESVVLSPERTEALRTVAKLVSAAMERLVQAEAAHELAANADAVSNVLAALVGVTDPLVAAQRACDGVRAAFGWAYGSYWERDRDADVLRFAIETGSVSAAFREVTRTASFAEGVGLSGRTWAARDVVFVPDLAEVTDCVRAPAARAAGVRSGVCLPVLVDGEVVATLDFFALERLTPSPARLDALRLVAGAVSTCMAQSQRVQHLHAVAAELAAASRQLLATASDLDANAAATTTRAVAVSGQTEEISENLTLIATGADELDSSVGEISTHAAQAAEVAAGAVGTARAANATVAKLQESSAQIGDIVDAITMIAQQTNLLALNATIEAARAGAAGKGFAVVASEVKELAKSTATATKEISQKIAATTADTEATIEALTTITHTIERVSELQNRIAEAVLLQSVTAGEMTRNVADAAVGSSQIADSMSGLAAMADGTRTHSADAHALAATLHDLATSLLSD